MERRLFLLKQDLGILVRGLGRLLGGLVDALGWLLGGLVALGGLLSGLVVDALGWLCGALQCVVGDSVSVGRLLFEQGGGRVDRDVAGSTGIRHLHSGVRTQAVKGPCVSCRLN